MARRKAGHPIQEFPLIRQLQRRYERSAPDILQGIGDDAAVVSFPARSHTVLTTDLLAEGVHFDLRTASPASVGYRAAMANLSDIAAMGAVPRFLLVSIAIPRAMQATDIHALYEGMMTACRRHRVHLIGGDTSASQQGLFLTITLLGTTPRNRTLFRHGARVGDDIYVTGTLGDSLAGLQLLRETRPTRLNPADREYLKHRHWHPTARVEEGLWLNRAGLVHAAIDVSDGLSGDLRHVCEASRVGADIELARLPISPACRAYAHRQGLDPIALALAGGEDYELLFTAPPACEPRLTRQARTRGFLITHIGTIRPKRLGIHAIAADGTRRPLPVTSYRHFE